MLWPAPEFRVRLRRARNGPATEAHSAEMRLWNSLRLLTEGQAIATLGSSPLFLISRSGLSSMCRPQLILIKLSCGVCRNTSRKSTEAELRTLQVPICLEEPPGSEYLFLSPRNSAAR